MSRIHEALKKAEKEKTTGTSSQDVDVLVESPATDRGMQSTFGEPGGLPAAAGSKAGTGAPPAALRFEELWTKCAVHKWNPDPSLLVFNNSNPSRPGTEQFRTLRSRLYRIRESQPLQTILVSSAIPAEGKTVVAANLALALAQQQGSRVLLIDADLRASRAHSLLGVPAAPGLVDYLQGGMDEFAVIQRGNEEGLCFIPGGNHAAHPSELISSSRMKQFLERARSVFDWIIIDSSPVLPVADASVLGSLCDGVLVVVRASSTPSETAQKACREFKGANVLGVVLNTVEQTSEYGSYYASGPYGESPKGGSRK